MRHPIVLLSSVSILALAVTAPVALAADLPVRQMVTKAPLMVRDTWTWYLEGGASHVSGDPQVAGLTSGFDVMPKSWGWQGAVGVDYRAGGSPWHYSAAFRYSGFGSNSASSIETGTFGGVPTVGTNSASRKEHNWAADFMVGRDMGFGPQSQVKVGIRVAEIWGNTNGQAQFTPTLVSSPTQVRAYDQTNRFLGVGPRVAVEGSVPMAGAWSFDYNGGLAGLFGRSTVDQGVTASAFGFGGGLVACTAGCPITASSSSNNVVFNADVQAGVAYAFTPAAKLSLNYRAEGYWNALRGFNAAGNGTNLDRIYHGPTLKLTMSY